MQPRRGEWRRRTFMRSNEKGDGTGNFPNHGQRSRVLRERDRASMALGAR